MVPTYISSQYYSPASAEAYLADFGSRGYDLSLSQAVITLHGFWRGGFFYTKDVFDLWFIPFIAIAIISIIGILVLFKEENIKSLYLILIFLAGFLLSLGSESPLLWLFKIDFLSLSFVFRDTQKFVGLMALVYSVAGAYGLYFLSKRSKLFMILLLVPVIYNFGFFGFIDQIHSTQYPDSWAKADAIIAEDTTDSSILPLPLHLYNTYMWVNGSQKTIANPAGQFFSKPTSTIVNIETKHIYSDKFSSKDRYFRYIYANRGSINNTAELLLPLNIGYIFLSKSDIDAPHYFYLLNYTDPNIKLVYHGPSFFLFRNELVKGRITSTPDNISTFEDFINASYSSNVTYEKIHPAYFYVSDSEHQYIVFSSLNSFLEFNGKKAISRSVASVFEFTGPGALVNTLFYYVLALFLLSWFVLLALLTTLDRKIMFVLFVLLYLLIGTGIIVPHAVGWLMIFTLFIFLYNGYGYNKVF
jgi:hypothetical protein